MTGIFDTGIFDTGIFDHPAISNADVNGVVSKTQDANTVSATGEVRTNTGVVNVEQAGDSLSATGAVQIKATSSAQESDSTLVAVGRVLAAGSLSATEADDTVVATINKPINGEATGTQDDNTLSTVEPYFVAPSYGHWVKKQNAKKPKAPQLPPPVQPGEVVIDEAVLRQMEEERLAALVLQKKTEALERVEELRTYAPADRRPTRSITIDPRRFDIVEAAPEIRTRVINLFRPPPPAPLKEPVRGSITLRALGPRHLPQPEIRKARTISLRRSSDRMMQTGT